jgi:predicted Na+-dependent transporter
MLIFRRFDWYYNIDDMNWVSMADYLLLLLPFYLGYFTQPYLLESPRLDAYCYLHVLISEYSKWLIIIHLWCVYHLQTWMHQVVSAFCMCVFPYDSVYKTVLPSKC